MRFITKSKKRQGGGDRSHRRRRRAALLITAIIALLALALVSCATTEQLAPPVSEAMLDLDAGGRASMAALEHGRRIYLTKCATCHTAEPVARYSADAWPGIIRRMAPLSALSVAEEADLLAYVKAARRLASIGASN